MPGSNARALAKARALPADGLIFDLEDAVAPDAKAAARERVAEALGEGGYGTRERVVRINGLATPWGRDDLAAAARMDCDAVLLPKVDHAAHVGAAVEALEAAGAPERMQLWCMMETPKAALNANAIAGCREEYPRLTCLVMGTSDLAAELHAAHTRARLPLLTALSTCVLAARAYGFDILDGVYLDLNDLAGFEEACRQGVELGFDGKTLIHPRQIGPANAAFAPDDEALNRARAIIAAHDEARAKGAGVTTVGGRLVELLHVAEAQRTLALADAIAGWDV